MLPLATTPSTPRILSAPVSLMAGETASLDITARAGSTCRLTVTQGGRTWTSKAQKLSNPKSKALQFPWTQTAGQPASELTATVTCRKGRDLTSTAVTVPVVSDGEVGLSEPKLHKPVLLALRTRNPVEMGGAKGSPAFGTVQVPGGHWLDGRGVDVVSNGGSTYDCPGGRCQYHSYGIKWQCVELVNRFLMTKGWSGRIWGNAKDMYANSPGRELRQAPRR